MSPDRCWSKFTSVCFKLISWINISTISSETGLRAVPLKLIDKTTLVQVMTWCHQVTNHNMSQCWPRHMAPYHKCISVSVRLWNTKLAQILEILPHARQGHTRHYLNQCWLSSTMPYGIIKPQWVEKCLVPVWHKLLSESMMTLVTHREKRLNFNEKKEHCQYANAELRWTFHQWSNNQFN